MMSEHHEREYASNVFWILVVVVVRLLDTRLGTGIYLPVLKRADATICVTSGTFLTYYYMEATRN